MKVITAAELVEILRKHKMWLAGDPSGVRANLYGANLTRANLYEANLYEANLTGANLTGANLTGANLTGANLYGANLTGANLTGANLYEANLTGANLTGANLTRANLTGANLTGANLYGANLYGANHLDQAENVKCPIACPEKGSFTAFKKVRGNYIVELEIPADALRCSATSRKCRCSKAKVMSITNVDGSPATVDIVYSQHDSAFSYKVGDVVKVDNFDPDRWHECAPGIHFFITRQEAVDY